MENKPRDHGGGLDTAINRYGGQRDEWIDLSTGINPNPYRAPNIPLYFWQTLPDKNAQNSLISAAKKFWNVPDRAGITSASGVSSIIAMLPMISGGQNVSIEHPTYNEFAAAYHAHGKCVSKDASVQIVVHPNNPDGRLINRNEILDRHQNLTIIDESFCDICPEKSLIDLTANEGFIVLKGMGKFWGLAGLRLGFAIGSGQLLRDLQSLLGPWNISGPAQFIGQQMLTDYDWANATRISLSAMVERMDKMLSKSHIKIAGGCDLFRLAHVMNATGLHTHLCKHKILTRVFPYSENWIRFGLPANDDQFRRLHHALESFDGPY